MKTLSVNRTSAAQTALFALSMVLAGASLPAHALDDAGAALQPKGSYTYQQYAGSLYSAALYLDENMANSDAALASTGSKQLRIVMLHDVTASEMGDLLAKAVTATASDEELSKLIPVLFGLGEMFGEHKTLAAGDSLLIGWTAAKGTSISIQPKGASQAPEQFFSHPGMFGVMQRVWLGEQPSGQKI